MGPEELLALMPFSKGCGIELAEATKDRVVGRMSWTAERCTSGVSYTAGPS